MARRSRSSGAEGESRGEAEEVTVQVNCAASVDGKLSTIERRQVGISGEEDMQRVHRLRSEFDAVAIGIGTMLADDPKLTSKGGEDPLRIVVDSSARTPIDSELLHHGDEGPLIAVSDEAPEESIRMLESAGAEVLRTEGPRTDLRELVESLADRGVGSLLVEGGGELIMAFFEERLVDRLSVFYGGRLFGGSGAPTIADGEGFPEEEAPSLELMSYRELDGGVLTEWRAVYV